MTCTDLSRQINSNNNCLCIGLDPELGKIPKHLLGLKDPIFEFNKAIIEATKNECVAYKPNIAFYESLGRKGWESLEKTMEVIPSTHFTIADAKRGDIGNSSKKYAETFFDTFDFDAVTVAPYMGEDSVRPFLEYSEKVTILLGLTSNAGSENFQKLKLKNGSFLFETVLKEASKWGSPENLMFVVGATNAASLTQIRAIIPDHFLLIPGIGAQGGDIQEVITKGKNSEIGLLINVSRSIIYASNGEDFSLKAQEEAKNINAQYQSLLG